MKFLYCRECGNLRPRGWRILIRRCEICGSEMAKINVNTTIVGPAYYASIVATSLLLVLYLLEYPLPYDGQYLLLVATIIMLLLAFIDYSISYRRAKEIVREDEEKRKGSEE